MVRLFDVQNGKVGIYKVTSPSGKCYIGQTYDFERRYTDYKRMSCKKQPYLYHSLKKYGVSNHSFEVLCSFPNDVSVDVLNKAEEDAIDEYKEKEIPLMNIRGGGGSKGKLAESTKLKLSLANKGKKRTYVATDEYRKNISERNRNRVLSEDTKQLIRSKARKGSAHTSSRKIYQFTLDNILVKEWDSVIEACDGLRGYKYVRIINAAKGRIPAAFSYKWNYDDKII
jgi:group I intron endonuclease